MTMIRDMHNIDMGLACRCARRRTAAAYAQCHVLVYLHAHARRRAGTCTTAPLGAQAIKRRATLACATAVPRSRARMRAPRRPPQVLRASHGQDQYSQMPMP